MDGNFCEIGIREIDQSSLVLLIMCLDLVQSSTCSLHHLKLSHHSLSPRLSVYEKDTLTPLHCRSCFDHAFRFALYPAGILLPLCKHFSSGGEGQHRCEPSCKPLRHYHHFTTTLWVYSLDWWLVAFPSSLAPLSLAILWDTYFQEKRFLLNIWLARPEWQRSQASVQGLIAASQKASCPAGPWQCDLISFRHVVLHTYNTQLGYTMP